MSSADSRTLYLTAPRGDWNAWERSIWHIRCLTGQGRSISFVGRHRKEVRGRGRRQRRRGDSVTRLRSHGGILCELALLTCLGLVAAIGNADAQQLPRRVGVLLVGYSPESREAQ